MTDAVIVDQQSGGLGLFIVHDNSSGQSGSERFSSLSLHDERSNASDSSRFAPEGEHLNNGDGVEDSEENGNLRSRRVAVQYVDGSALDEHVDKLVMYFQTEQLSGGSNFKCWRLSHDKKILFITFEHAISQKLLEKQHKYKKRSLNVTVLEPEIKDDNGQSLAFGMSLEGKDMHFMKVGIPCLFNYLRRRGVECTNAAYNADQNCWVYTVKNGSDIEKIFDRNLSETTFTFDGMTLTLFRVTNDAIEPFVDGPEEEDKFLVTRLPPGAKEGDLKLFVEQNSSNTIASMELQTGRAMLTLKKPYDFPGLAQAVHAIPLKGYMLAIQKVPLSLAILVSSNGKELDEEDLEIALSFYAQQCTGNRVDHFIQEICIIDKQTKMKAIVKFMDRQVLNEILANCKDVGTLTLYHDCMRDEQPSSSRTPEVISFTDPLLNTGS